MDNRLEAPLKEEEIECIYDSERMMLTRGAFSIQLPSNEGFMLAALIDGVTDKEDIIERVWGARGLVVTDNSYYKALHGLRACLAEVGLDRSALKTLPRRGVLLLCTITTLPVRERVVQPEARALEVAEGLSQHLAVAAPEIATTHADLNPLPDAATSVSIAPSSEVKQRSFNRFLTLAIVYGFSALSVGYYAYLHMTAPPELAEWQRLGHLNGIEIYKETGENVNLEEISRFTDYFNPVSHWQGVGYYVRKTMSELLIVCDKPEYDKRSLCSNFLIIEKN